MLPLFLAQVFSWTLNGLLLVKMLAHLTSPDAIVTFSATPGIATTPTTTSTTTAAPIPPPAQALPTANADADVGSGHGGGGGTSKPMRLAPVSLDSPAKALPEIKHTYQFEFEVRWFCFYFGFRI